MIYWEEIVYVLLIFEVIIISAFLLIIPFHRVFLHYNTRNQGNSKKEISEIIMDSLVKGKSDKLLEKLKKYSGTEVLLLNLEKFNRLITGPEWQEVKNKVTESYLLPKARSYASKNSWMKRNFAARCFVLTPKKIDEDKINHLVKDPNFLVSSIASMAAVKLENKEMIYEIIRKSGREKGYSRYFYRDLFAKQNNTVFKMIQEIAETDKDSDTHLACLELLTERAIIRVPHYIESDLKSKNPKVRLNATKIVARNPNEKTITLLTQGLNDEDPEIRAEAIHGFQYFPSNEVLDKLENLMNDTHFLVRFTAAQTLWRMGKKGRDILKNQETNDAAKNVLQYHGG
jgi:hypothetical protein